MKDSVKFLILVFPMLVHAKVQTLDMNLNWTPARLTWTDKGVSIHLKGAKPIETQLARLKEAQVASDWRACFDRAKGLFSSSVSPWVHAVDLDCAINAVKQTKKYQETLKASISRIEAQPAWLLTPPYAEIFKKRLKEGYFTLLESEKNPSLVLIEKILQRESWLLQNEKAKLYRMAGETSFVEKNLKAAREFYLRSLNYEDNSDARARIKSIELLISSRSEKKDPDVAAKRGAVVKDERLEASKGELELFDRITQYLKTGDLVSAVEDAVTLMNEYPGGVRASWAQDRVYESFVQVSDKEDKKFALSKDRILALMKKAEGLRLQSWAQLAFKSENYEDAFELSREAIGKLGSLATTKLIFLCARTAYFIDKLGTAKDLFDTIVEKHSGTEEAVESLFNLALISIRRNDYAAAASSLEKLLVVPRTSNLEIKARYWLWRSLQVVDPKRASAEAEYLINRYPLTYYGLLARFETQGAIGPFPDGPKIQTKFSGVYFQKEQDAWKRLELLVRSGWFEEAKLELQQIPEPQELKAKVFYAQLASTVMDYQKSILLLNKVWDEDGTYLNQTLLKVAFPREYGDLITEEARFRKIEPELVRALIRQESGYNLKAVSSSGALGLMQMIPPTAQEVAQDLHVKNIKLPDDLFQPKNNVKFCTFYLAKLLSQFDGNVPMALAAYNAGPARLKRWIKNRKILTKAPVSPQDEIWFDEIPWGETQSYVKAILRNLVIYRMLDRGRAEVSTSFWTQPIL